MARCSFCGINIERGTGKIKVQKTGALQYFCTRRCEKNLLKLGRNPLKIEWTYASRKFRGKLKTGEEVVTTGEEGKVKSGPTPTFVEDGRQEKKAGALKEEDSKPEKREAKPKEEKK